MKRRFTLFLLAALWLTASYAQKRELGPMPTPTADATGFATGNVQLSGPGAFLLADLKQGISAKQLAERYTIVRQGSVDCVPAFLELASGATQQQVEGMGVRVQSATGSILSALIPLSAYEELIYSGLVARVDVSVPNKPLIDRVRTEVNVDSVYNGLRLPQAYTGAGVVVGVVDVGFEYGHPAFYDSTGTTLRIKRVWEQTSTSGTHPSGYTYGRELTTADDILAAVASSTTETHGTHVAGIAAGCGGNTADMRAFRGMAPEADIVLVATNMSSTGIYDGIAYIGNYASSVGKPCVINLSLGSQVGPHDGTSTFDRACDSYLAQYGNGLLLVGAAGNEGADKLHIRKTFSSSDTLLYTLVDFDGSSAGSTTIDLWGEDNSTFMVALGILNTTSGQFEDAGYYRRSSAQYTYSEDFRDDDGERMTATIYCNGVNSYNGRSNISILLDNSRQTSNTQRAIIVLRANSGTVHIWGNKCTFVNGGFSVITAGNTDYTVSETGGTGNSMITVGAYTTRNSWVSRTGTPYDISSSATVGDIAYFSSRGPRLDGRTKPDITAPGQMTIAPINRLYTSYVSGGYTTNAATFNGNTEYYGAMQGTSMSTPVVAGIMALWLQHDSTLNPTTAMALLKSTAISDSHTGDIPQSGSNTWGYGKIDAYAALDTAGSADPLDTTSCLITSLPYSNDFESGARCWSVRDANSNNRTWSLIGQYGYNASTCAYINDTSVANDWFISPRTIVAGDIAVEWKVAAINANNVESYRVWLMTQDTAIMLWGENIVSTTFQDRTVYFRNALHDTAQIIFQYVSSRKVGIFIDDFAMRQTTLHALNVNSNNVAQGTVSGSGYYLARASVQMSATAATGYRFTCWQDGNSDNPRTVELTADTTFTAYFEVDALTQTTLNAIDTNTCLITTLPYFIDFDTSIYCWRLRDINGDSKTWSIINGYGVNSSRCMFINPAANANDILYSPGIVVTGHMVLDWKARSYNANYPNAYRVYLFTSNGTDIIFQETLASTSFVDRSVAIDIPAGDTAQIAFQYIADDMSPFFIDNVALRRVVSPVQYTLTVVSNNVAQGTVSGSGTYNSGSTATLTATPLSGYHFVSWQDDNTDNPRTVTVTANATYTAYFASDDVPVQYTLTVVSANTMQGVVNGGGVYASGDVATLTATAAEGYHFVSWQDDNTDNPRTVTVTSDASYVAYFEADRTPTPTYYTLTVETSDPAQGSVSGGGVYRSSVIATLTAIPATGYHFLRWQDGNTDNPRMLIVRADAYHMAYFESDTAPSQFTIVVVSSDSLQGAVSGSGTYTIGDSATLIATPYAGYLFVGWQDGNTENPRKMVVRSNGVYTAYFMVDPNPPANYTLTVVSADASQGSVSGGGTYNSGTTVTLTATPNTGYRFLKWQDDNTDNPRTVTVTANATYTAYFESDGTQQRYTLTVESADLSQGAVTGGGTYNSGATATLTAIPATGYHFLRWQDDNTDNPRTVTVTANATYTAYFEADGAPQSYTLTVESADPTMGTATGGGTYNSGATATLTAIPATGYHFLRWQDDNTDNPRTVTVTANATYTAYFERDLGISDVEGIDLRIMVSEGYLKIVATQGTIPPYTVNDVAGRCLYRSEGVQAVESIATPQLQSGVYFVHFMGLPAQKVVVVR